jgi:3-oxoadipate enol-lactonase
MPYATAPDGTRLHFAVFGNEAGPPLLMIQGLGADARAWAFQRRALGRRFRCIAFDNRGAGRSDKPTGSYDLEAMAADAVAVLDEVGIDRAHVMGASMGGVIAQLVAVRHPSRVRSLVLACTACRHHPWRRELLEDWARTAERGLGAMSIRSFRWVVGPRSQRRLFLALQLFGSVLRSVPPHAFAGQVEAILSTDDALRTELTLLSLPTLVIVGSQDILTPVGDSEELAELIPGAELVVLSGAAHGLMVEHASTYNRIVGEFLDRVSQADGVDDGAADGTPSTSRKPSAARASTTGPSPNGASARAASSANSRATAHDAPIAPSDRTS